MQAQHVFITGATGYVGRRLIPLLLERRHEVRALVRSESRDKAPPGCEVIVGNPLARTWSLGAVAVIASKEAPRLGGFTGCPTQAKFPKKPS